MSIHEKWVEAYRAIGYKNRGLSRKVTSMVVGGDSSKTPCACVPDDEDYEICKRCVWYAEREEIGFGWSPRSDAWSLDVVTDPQDPDNPWRVLNLVEVEVTHPLSPNKEACYFWLADNLFGHGVQTYLTTCDRRGVETVLISPALFGVRDDCPKPRFLGTPTWTDGTVIGENPGLTWGGLSTKAHDRMLYFPLPG